MYKFCYYDDELKIYIDKASDKVSYLKQKIFCRKVLLFTLIVVLGIAIAILLFNKMLG